MEFVTEAERKLQLQRSTMCLLRAAASRARRRLWRQHAAGRRCSCASGKCMLGGLGTLGIVTIYLPLCDGCGRQVSYGISEELLRLSIKHGAEARYPAPWLEGGTVEEKTKTRFEVQYNAHLFAIELERLLLQEGVTLLYATQVSA